MGTTRICYFFLYICSSSFLSVVSSESPDQFTRLLTTYSELERRVRQNPGVLLHTEPSPHYSAEQLRQFAQHARTIYCNITTRANDQRVYYNPIHNNLLASLQDHLFRTLLSLRNLMHDHSLINGQSYNQTRTLVEQTSQQLRVFEDAINQKIEELNQ